jgi:hypothetical protein
MPGKLRWERRAGTIATLTIPERSVDRVYRMPRQD